jgi:non-specific serine/threonine protein kinase/serine/threonine-protein kinase
VDSEELIARFRVERQILAAFDHVNIARLLDGGTTEHGLPYLVMEYVDGLPIDQYCDQERLTVQERLRLFLPVCAAVQHAHQNLVVHRDLKPGNILVTVDGTPKLLDFGVAKLLRPELAPVTQALTGADLRLFTPGYASPEQVLGDPITTAADVYSLSAVLYVLLTGQTPYRFKSFTPQELYDIARWGEPMTPSAVIQKAEKSTTPESVSQARNTRPEPLRRLLSGDLDNILLRGLQKEPQRRYSSAEQFADDIRRYLQGLPVRACKETFIYRTTKFVRRNKGGVAAAVLVVCTLIGGVVATAWQAQVARSERVKAERRFQDVRKLAHSVVFELHDAIQNLPGSTKARELLVKRALEYLDSLAQEATGDTFLQLELADAYDKVSRVQWSRLSASLGDRTGSMTSQRKALAIRKAILEAHPENRAAKTGLATSYMLIADGKRFDSMGHLPAALDDYRYALGLRQELAAANPKDREARTNLGQIYMYLGDALYSVDGGNANMGDLQAAAENFLKAREAYEEAAAQQPQDATARQSLAPIYERLANVRIGQGEFQGALEWYGKALAIAEEMVRQQPQDARARRNLALFHERIGTTLLKLNNPQSTLQSYSQALHIRESLAGADPENALAYDHLIRSLRLMSPVLLKLGRHSDVILYTKRLLATEKARVERPSATASDLNSYAWDLITCQQTQLRNPALGLSVAKRAAAMTDYHNPGILDTLALALFNTGDRAGAMEFERQAVAATANVSERKGYEATLRRYQAIR